jgi:hypothetical protein
MRSVLASFLLVLSLTAGVCSLALAKPPSKPAPQPQPRLADLISCRGTMQDWRDLAGAYHDPAIQASWGWRAVKVGDGLLEAIALRDPIVVFGEKVARVAFSGSGVVALLQHKTLQALVKELKLEPVVQGQAARIFGKTVQSTTEKLGDGTLKTTISLSVSTSESYPGLVLAGCSYEVAMDP